ncbi:hypothetical protein ACEN88_33955, partial [Massilia sp. CT11-108]
MWVLAVTVYFVLACAISWMVLFPAGREFVLDALAGGRGRRGPGAYKTQTRPPQREGVMGGVAGSVK